MHSVLFNQCCCFSLTVSALRVRFFSFDTPKLNHFHPPWNMTSPQPFFKSQRIKKVFISTSFFLVLMFINSDFYWRLSCSAYIQYNHIMHKLVNFRQIHLFSDYFIGFLLLLFHFYYSLIVRLLCCGSFIW